MHDIVYKYRPLVDLYILDFLNKAEDFLKILKKNGHLDAKKMGCGVSQVSVLEWLLKNNFNF